MFSIFTEMDFNFFGVKARLGKDYFEHKLFEELRLYSEFYELLSYTINQYGTLGTKSLLNLDVYFFKSIKGTIDSISEILEKGRINDAYALMRKYYDSSFINIYTNLYLRDNFGENNLVVQKIENWLNGTETIPEYGIISRYIKESPRLKPIAELIKKDKRYAIIRKRCNDNMHYNFFHNLLLNDNEVYNSSRFKYLDMISSDMCSLFIQHFAYTFYLNHGYLMSSDYTDQLEFGLSPDDESYLLVAPFIQNIFDGIIKKYRPDIAKVIMDNTDMKLQ